MSHESEKSAIEEMSTNWLTALLQGGEAGADGYASYMTEDVICLPPNSDRVDGRAGVRELMLGFTTADGFSITWRNTEVLVTADGKQANVIGTFEYSLNDDQGNPVSEKGKFFDLFEKQSDDTWLCSVAMWNSDLGGA